MMLYLLIGIIVGVGLWWALRPSWLPKPPAPPIPQWITHATEKISAWPKTLAPRHWLTTAQTQWASLRWPRRAAEPPTAFQTWARAEIPAHHAQRHPENATETEALRAWLTGLSAAKWHDYYQSLTTFCETMGFDLAWAWKHNPPPEQTGALREMSMLHTLAYWRAETAQLSLAFTRWLATPVTPAHTPITGQVLKQLLAQETLKLPAELILAPKAERERYLINATRELAQTRPSDLQAAFAQAWARA